MNCVIDVISIYINCKPVIGTIFLCNVLRNVLHDTLVIFAYRIVKYSISLLEIREVIKWEAPSYFTSRPWPHLR